MAALALIWVLSAARISTIEGLEILDADEEKITMSVMHLKGSLSNYQLMRVYCNCHTPPPPGEPGDTMCPLHSPDYHYSLIPTPVTRQMARATITALDVQTHSPRVTLAHMIRHLREYSSDAYNLLHMGFINSIFVWQGSQPTMFNYYTRTPQKIVDACKGGRFAIPVHAIIRACRAMGWDEGVPTSNPHQAVPALPQHVVEILACPGLNLNV